MENTVITANNALEYDLTRLQTLIAEFKTTDIWKTMQSTVEDSPWHREANVAVHTEMTLEAAAKHFPQREPGEEYSYLDRRHIVLVSLALLFHDTGKPVAEVEKSSEDRGVYRSYAGHEANSARTFEDYVVKNWATQFEGFITEWDTYVITWMIEHHLPFYLKQKDKLVAFDKTLSLLFEPNTEEVFFNMLKGDTGGRISDAYDVNYANMINWIDDRKAALVENRTQYVSEFTTAAAEFEYTDNPAMIMLIGPSGSGKSTIRDTMNANGKLDVFSLDDLRIEFAGIEVYKDKHEQYELSYEYCIMHEKEFTAFTQSRMTAAFRAKKNLIIDNTNVGAKRRRQYLTLADQHGYLKTAMYVPSSLDQLLRRQHTRGDKGVPANAVAQQFNAIAVPSLGGEFNIVWVAKHNFGASE